MPDVELAEKATKEAAFIDTAVPPTHNLQAKITEN
jgi:hypothetical protein